MPIDKQTRFTAAAPANPQGKGQVPVLEALNGPNAIKAPEKHPPVSTAQAFSAYLMSRVVLCAAFNFRVIPERTYHLYVMDSQFKLSLVAPDEWGNQHFGTPVGHCRMRTNKTWRLTITSSPAALKHIRHALLHERSHLLSDLYADARVADTLTDYDERLPFKRRILARGLAQTTRKALAQFQEHSISELLSLAKLESQTDARLLGTFMASD